MADWWKFLFAILEIRYWNLSGTMLFWVVYFTITFQTYNGSVP
jgi:hypothetical protein